MVAERLPPRTSLCSIVLGLELSTCKETLIHVVTLHPDLYIDRRHDPLMNHAASHSWREVSLLGSIIYTTETVSSCCHEDLLSWCASLPYFTFYCIYSRSFCKRAPRKFEKVVVTRGVRLRGWWALVSHRMVKQWRVVAYETLSGRCHAG